MTIRDAVRATQRRIAALDAAHGRAATALERAVAHRAVVLAEQDELVARAREELDAAVAAMVAAIGAELTASVLDRDLADVRRCGKPRAVARTPRVGGPRQPSGTTHDTTAL